MKKWGAVIAGFQFGVVFAEEIIRHGGGFHSRMGEAWIFAGGVTILIALAGKS